MFAANVPEKLIAERTGHRSTKGLRVYERTSMEQKQSVSDIIACSSKRDFEEEETSRGDPRISVNGVLIARAAKFKPRPLSGPRPFCRQRPLFSRWCTVLTVRTTVASIPSR